MKRTLSILFSVFLVLVLFTACSSDDESEKNNNENANINESGNNDNNAGDSNNDDSANNNENNESGDNSSSDELVKAAQEEGKVVVYSATSRINNAAELFEEKYGIEVEAYNIAGTELIQKVSQEGASGVIEADFVIAQESGRIKGELMDTGYLENIVPAGVADIIPEENQDPLSLLFITKLFIYNSETYDMPPVNSIWELTEEEWKGKVFMKDPKQEGVNVDFFTMLTSPEVSEQIADAYERYYGEEITLTEENAGYEWMKALFDNDVVLFNSDTRVTEAVGIKGNDVEATGLFVYNKLRDRESKDLALLPIMGMDPFAGFYYPMSLLRTTDAKHPNAAELFMEFLLTEEGFAPWDEGIGTYSANPEIPIHVGDNKFDTWKEILVGEDPDYIFENRGQVEEFLDGILY